MFSGLTKQEIQGMARDFEAEAAKAAARGDKAAAESAQAHAETYRANVKHGQDYTPP